MTADELYTALVGPPDRPEHLRRPLSQARLEKAKRLAKTTADWQQVWTRLVEEGKVTQ